MKKKREFPNTFVIIFAIILISAVATWIVPGGEYVKAGDGTVVFSEIQSEPQTWQVLSALYNGFEKQAGIIVFILVVGASFWLVNSTKAIDVGIHAFLDRTRRLEKNAFVRKIGVDNIIMTSIMLVFSVFGGVFGMSEEAVAFVIIIVPLAIRMGYDSITGLCLVYVASHVGFAGAFLNPFTIGIAQGIAGLPLFSGIEYRFLCWTLLNILLITAVLLYAARVKRNPQTSVMYEADAWWRERLSDGGTRPQYYRNASSWVSFGIALCAILYFTVRYSSGTVLEIGSFELHVPWLLPLLVLLFAAASIFSLRKSVHFYILTILCFTILYLVVGVLCFQWYIPEISALFLAMAILSGIAAGYSANSVVRELMNGAKDILSAALVIGLAAGIIIILQDGHIIDTILHSMASSLGEASRLASLSLMYGIQTLINLVIPSATAKAAITIPIMAPFADIIGLSRQATVLAFQFGDGFTNMITPTSGVLIAALGLARIPYSKWVKWVWKFILVLIMAGFLLLVPAVTMDLPGF